MFVDVSIKFTESELHTCKKVLDFLQQQPDIKLGTLADQLIEEAHKEVVQEAQTETEAPQPKVVDAPKEEAKPAKAESKPITSDDIKNAGKKLAAAKGMPAFLAILKKHGVKSISELPKESYEEVMGELNA